MLVEKKCPYCNKVFQPVTERHKYCSQKCYRKYYWHNIEKPDGYPVFLCPVCKKEIKLSFDPRKNFMRFKRLVCPHCGNKNVVGV